jgi:hypothetical protein
MALDNFLQRIGIIIALFYINHEKNTRIKYEFL